MVRHLRDAPRAARDDGAALGPAAAALGAADAAVVLVMHSTQTGTVARRGMFGGWSQLLYDNAEPVPVLDSNSPMVLFTFERAIGWWTTLVYCGPTAELPHRPIRATDWWAWRKCPVCAAPIGSSCTSRSGRVVAGTTDLVVTKLDKPHMLRIARKLR